MSERSTIRSVCSHQTSPSPGTERSALRRPEHSSRRFAQPGSRVLHMHRRVQASSRRRKQVAATLPSSRADNPPDSPHEPDRCSASPRAAPCRGVAARPISGCRRRVRRELRRGTCRREFEHLRHERQPVGRSCLVERRHDLARRGGAETRSPAFIRRDLIVLVALLSTVAQAAGMRQNVAPENLTVRPPTRDICLSVRGTRVTTSFGEPLSGESLPRRRSKAAS